MKSSKTTQSATVNALIPRVASPYSPRPFHTSQEQQRDEQKENKTGLPDYLKVGVEQLSGLSLDDVKVHYNSDKPPKLQAYAYAQGTEIHLASGQERHLPHEAWHIVQQKQGRVRPTFQMKNNININDDKRLEKEADAMGVKALNATNRNSYLQKPKQSSPKSENILQAVWDPSKPTKEKPSRWNVLIDGVRWYTDSEGLMWFEIEIERKNEILEGNKNDYEKLAGPGNRRSWQDWNDISISPLKEMQITYQSAVESDVLIDEIQNIARTNTTTGIWYAWGPKKYMIQWALAGSIKKHGLAIKGGEASPQGPGLYLAKDAWRSSVYAKEGAYLLVAKLNNVPTINKNNGPQMTALGRLGLTLEDLYQTHLLGDFLLIYTSAGTYGRLTTNNGVLLTTDLRDVDISIIKEQFSKLAGDAQPVLRDQAKYYKVNLGI